MKITKDFKIINEFRHKIPVDIDGLVIALGLDITYVYLEHNVSGILEKQQNGRYLIKVNDEDPLTRQRFTVAHELGHYLLHLNRIGEGIAENRLYRSTQYSKYNNTQIGLREETEANQFAASLLMPWQSIRQLQEKGLTDYKDIADKLLVSRSAMAIRLGINNKINKN